MRGRLLSLLSWLRLQSRVGTTATQNVSCFILYVARLFLLIHLANPSVMLDGMGFEGVVANDDFRGLQDTIKDDAG